MDNGVVYTDIIQVFKGRQGNEILLSVLVETEGRGDFVTAYQCKASLICQLKLFYEYTCILKNSFKGKTALLVVLIFVQPK
jgi:hypothetical protein